jgi:hypothetical protein
VASAGYVTAAGVTTSQKFRHACGAAVRIAAQHWRAAVSPVHGVIHSFRVSCRQIPSHTGLRDDDKVQTVLVAEMQLT